MAPALSVTSKVELQLLALSVNHTVASIDVSAFARLLVFFTIVFNLRTLVTNFLIATDAPEGKIL